MEGIDFRSYDWDDTDLIKAYRDLEARNAKNKEKGNKRRKWKVGDYCRAIYPEDKSYYEAKVVALNGDFCTVEFLGYGDTEDVDFFELKESEGEKVRKKQIKESKANSYDYNGSINWKVGDYCRAIYPEDKSYYEAKVISLNGDFCTVEFLGYGDTEDVDFFELKESEGKKARKKQIKESKADSYDYNGSVDESEAGGETTDATVASYSSYKKNKHHVNQAANNTTYDTTMYGTTIHQQYPAPPPPAAAYYAPPAPMPTSMPFMTPQATMPQYPMPPATPMPKWPSIANNPFFSMLSSWYMAGYYMGLHYAQKENRGCQRCCSHSNSCCRN